MERAEEDSFRSKRGPPPNELQHDTERTGLIPSFQSYGAGDQLNSLGGTQNINQDGNQVTGGSFYAPVYVGTNEHFDPLRDCLRSLAFLEMGIRANEIDTAAQGTCEWLFQHEGYKSWASCDRGLLWIKGKPGSGKSTLMRHALNNFMERPQINEKAFILSFFFTGRGAELQRTPLGLFRSLLYQLGHVPDALSDLVTTFQQRCESIGKPGEKWNWHPSELQRFFESSLQKALKTRPLWLFVDALDECGEEDAKKLVKWFRSLLQRLPYTDLAEFRICFTCRHYPILTLDEVFEICVEDENNTDISAFVQDELSSFHKRTPSEVPNLITRRANGVFLWAWLVVHQVLDCELEGKGLKHIEDAILSVPRKLDDLYRRLIQNMGPDSRKLIQCLCFAMRPLLLNELQWLMLVEAECPHQSLHQCRNAGNYTSDDDVMMRRVQTLSCGLAEIKSKTKPVQFIHQSVKDFFLHKEGLLALMGTQSSANTETTKAYLEGKADYYLARTCIRYLKMDETVQRTLHKHDRGLKSDFPLLHYAATSWVAHLVQSERKGISQDDLLDYLSEEFIELWVQVSGIISLQYWDNRNDCPPEGTRMLHVVSRNHLVGSLQVILRGASQAGADINAKDDRGRTPLSWAAENGGEAIVRLLLENGAMVDSADIDGCTPLQSAAGNGDEAIVRLLLENGAMVDSADRFGWTPLRWAAENGYQAIVQLLLENGAMVDLADGLGQTPLEMAADRRQEAVVRLLLDFSDKDL